MMINEYTFINTYSVFSMKDETEQQNGEPLTEEEQDSMNGNYKLP